MLRLYLCKGFNNLLEQDDKGDVSAETTGPAPAEVSAGIQISAERDYYDPNRGPYRVSFSASAENLGRCPLLSRCLFCSILGLFTRSCFSTTSFLKVLLPLSSATVDQFPADYLKSQISLQQYLFIIKYAIFTYLTSEITNQENKADNVYLCLNIAIKGTPNGVKIVLNHRASRHLSHPQTRVFACPQAKISLNLEVTNVSSILS
ncbi:hypothetical protein V6N12_045567 [Hibiscus sabdariffa]|uniref:Uncharacterized protein n=1 Tax=Hibiscus sabdariffa TaxID=183260 RepID=A0ABR2G490_9ROSI